MRVMMLAFVAVIGVAVVADVVLSGMGFSAEQRLTGQAVRLDGGRE